MDAHSLHCPNCGAAVEPDATRCPYCRAKLATVSCPSCFARLFDGAAFCPACGARRSRSEADAAAERCPSCRGTLAGIEVGGTRLLECDGCDGTWLDADVFEGICASREAQAAVVHRYQARALVPGDARVRYRPCLRCGKMMNRVNFGRLSGTIVDVCRGHGTFLDAGELHAIMTFIQAGGLDRARATEIEALKEETRRLQQAQAAEARRFKSQDGRTWASASWSAGDVYDLIDALKRRP